MREWVTTERIWIMRLRIKVSLVSGSNIFIIFPHFLKSFFWLRNFVSRSMMPRITSRSDSFLAQNKTFWKWVPRDLWLILGVKWKKKYRIFLTYHANFFSDIEFRCCKQKNHSCKLCKSGFCCKIQHIESIKIFSTSLFEKCFFGIVRGVASYATVRKNRTIATKKYTNRYLHFKSRDVRAIPSASSALVSVPERIDTEWREAKPQSSSEVRSKVGWPNRSDISRFEQNFKKTKKDAPWVSFFFGLFLILLRE